MHICPLNPRSGEFCAAGLLTLGSSSFSAFPSHFTGTVTAYAVLNYSPITVAGPCRSFTGFPILPDIISIYIISI